MIAFLLDQGADIHTVDRKQNSPGVLFWTIVLSKGMPREDYEPLVSRFQSSTYIEDGQFTVLHKIVFGMSHANLEDTLSDSTKLIDQPDAYGRTPLAWAASRADLQSASTLLKHGADPNIVERGGWGPLHNSILTESHELSLLLLEGGADPNAPSRVLRETPLYVTCDYEVEIRHMHNLLQFGADL